MKKVYISMAVAIGLCIVMSILLAFSQKAMPEFQPGYEHFFNTGNIWYNIVNIAFLVLAASAVVIVPLILIITRSVATIKEKNRIRKLDKERDKRIKEELRRIREREAAEKASSQNE